MDVIYLDNAATTPMLPEVIEVMQQEMLKNFGNPSSVHQLGRKAKSTIETVRKNIAKHFNVTASEIIFTSGGTEADNLILQNAVLNLGVKRIITSKIEHHAVLHTIDYLHKRYNVAVEYVSLDEFGVVDLQNLEELLSDTSLKTLVSLMMINNEIGNVLPIDKVCTLCGKYNTLFHSDTVQAIGYYPIDLQETPIDFIVASAHKFHGPKGVGFMYVKKGLLIGAMLHGGGQEKGIRSGTENTHAILGMDKALEIACKDIKQSVDYQKEIKKYFIEGLKSLDNEINFNGLSADFQKSSHAILNVRFPIKDKLFLFNLDLKGVVASSGSACQSGANKMSHVLTAILTDDDLQKVSVRFSFSKFTTKEEITKVLKYLEDDFFCELKINICKY